MTKRINKKAQVYLIAAILIIAILVSVTSLRNYITKPSEEIKVYDLSKELNLESESVINFGTYNKQDTSYLLQDFSEKYSKFVEPGTELLFIYGNLQGFKATTYLEASTGSMELIIDHGTPKKITIEDRVVKNYELGKPIGAGKNKINVTISNYTYNFNLYEGENFFFIVKAGGYVAQTDMG